VKYLCLVCAERVPAQMPTATAARLRDEYLEFTQDIHQSGHLLSSQRLQPATAAITLRVRDATLSVTDGPFAATKEQISSYYLLEAQDLNEALQIAARIPGARDGCVEVRPIAEE
jgi:hypothetical protein